MERMPERDTAPLELEKPTKVQDFRGGWLIPAGRIQKVAFVLARHGFGELAERVLSGRTDGDLVRNRERVGERVARVLADLGPTYIKLGQLLATREDLFPPEVTRALSALHSSVAPMKSKLAMRAVEDALDVPVESAFAWFDPEPLAAASIGQVHRARLRNGTDVVVKIQRPGLPSMVSADLQMLRWLAALLARALPEVAALDPESLVDAFEHSITAELDFRREAANAQKLGELLAGAPEVRVPRVYPQFTRKTLLVLEHVKGRQLKDLDEASRRLVRGKLLRAFTRQILDHGVFHADPHPGNVLIEDGGRVVLLDLGAVEGVDGGLRGGVGRLVRAVALGRKRALCDAVLALSPNGATVKVDRARLEKDLQQLLADAGGAGDGAKVLGQMVGIGRNHKLKMAPSLVALVRALALLDGVLRGLDPARDLVADLRRELILSLTRRVRRFLGTVIGWPARLVSWPKRLMARAQQRLLPPASPARPPSVEIAARRS
jgi:ubiquinone biosynthesis protein